MALSAAVGTLWLTIPWYVVSGQPLLGGDFVAFYTLGMAARAGQWAMQYDWPSLAMLQVSLVPSSEGYAYPPTYPPLFPALYVPLTAFSFGAAYGIYAVASVLAYAGGIALAARGCTVVSRTHAVLGCALFPAFVMHIVMGQTTIWPFAGFIGGWWALHNGRPFAGGLLLSLVSLKPHFGMAMAVILPLTRSWRLVGGVASGVALHAALTLAICGVTAISIYVETTVAVLRDPSLIEPLQSDISQAWRAVLHGLVPDGYATAIWMAGALAVCWLVVRVWRRTEAWTLRIGALLLATFLATPHAIGYDGILLAPGALWMLDWSLKVRERLLPFLLAVAIAGFAVPISSFGGLPVAAGAAVCALWRLDYRLRRDFRIQNGLHENWLPAPAQKP